MTLTHVLLIALGYAVKAAVTAVLWRRYGHRVRTVGRLARRRRSAGRPVLARAAPGARRSLFLPSHRARRGAQHSASTTNTSCPSMRTPTPSER